MRSICSLSLSLYIHACIPIVYIFTNMSLIEPLSEIVSRLLRLSYRSKLIQQGTFYPFLVISKFHFVCGKLNFSVKDFQFNIFFPSVHDLPTWISLLSLCLHVKNCLHTHTHIELSDLV